MNNKAVTATININTSKEVDLVNIAPLIEAKLEENKIKDGFCLIFVPHSTCALVLTEDEPRLKRDWIRALSRLLPDLDWEHNQIDDNARSHLLAGLLRQERVIPIIDGQLGLGVWQQVFLVELDGPRKREVILSFVPWAGLEPARP